MKVWVITESTGYDVGDIVQALCSSEEKVIEWVTKSCRGRYADHCTKRHDRWFRYGELLPLSPEMSTEEFIKRNKQHAEWVKQFCGSTYQFDVEEWEIDE